jgi:hypothetical protein
MTEQDHSDYTMTYNSNYKCMECSYDGNELYKECRDCARKRVKKNYEELGYVNPVFEESNEYGYLCLKFIGADNFEKSNEESKDEKSKLVENTKK